MRVLLAEDGWLVMVMKRRKMKAKVEMEMVDWMFAIFVIIEVLCSSFFWYVYRVRIYGI